ncbi:MAG TPA: radical SAM protein [Polyangiaceae bacterium]
MYRRLPVQNPDSRFDRFTVEYDEGEAPEEGVELYDDQSKSILSENDSPDLGFRYSVNPYRGCGHGCSYCASGDTPILMADGRTKALGELRVSDRIVGTERNRGSLRYTTTVVLDHWWVMKPAYRVTLSDGTTLVTSGDHRLLTEDGWKYVASGDAAEPPRHRLGERDRLLGFDVGAAAPESGSRLDGSRALRVACVRPLDVTLRLFDITTGTGDFVANGIVSHNCYARPSHEYLGFGAGTDFERKLMVKRRAPELLREAFEKKSWKGELVVFSGNTDCYQPLESKLGLTRGCLEVCREYKNPAYVITKGTTVERDFDLLVALARDADAGLTVSIPFLDEKVARAMEPYAPTPARRLETVRRAAEAGIDVSINVAPLIPGLNDRDVVPLLEAAKAAGASSAGTSMLRLPGPVAEVFAQRLERDFPLAAEKILRRVREMRGGKLNDSRFGARMAGEGTYADTIRDMFEVTARRLGLDHRPAAPRPSTFERPVRGQLKLFD